MSEIPCSYVSRFGRILKPKIPFVVHWTTSSSEGQLVLQWSASPTNPGIKTTSGPLDQKLLKQSIES